MCRRLSSSHASSVGPSIVARAWSTAWWARKIPGVRGASKERTTRGSRSMLRSFNWLPMCDVTRSSPSRPSQIDGDLRAPVGVDRAEVGQRAGLDELAEFGFKRGHRLDTVRWRGCSCAPRTRWRPSSGRRTRRRGRRSPSSSRTRRPASGRRSTAASPTRVASCRRCTGSRRRPRRCCTPCTRTSRSSPGRSRVRRSTRSTCASACRGCELEPGSDVLRDLYQQLLPGRLRGALGEFLTPPWLAEACLRRLEETGAPLASGRVLDPTCGTGTFLLARARPPARRAAGLGRGHAAVRAGRPGLGRGLRPQPRRGAGGAGERGRRAR